MRIYWDIIGALDGPMLQVVFEKMSCLSSIYFMFPCRFLNSLMSHLCRMEWPMPYAIIIFLVSIGFMSYFNFKNVHLSDFRVKSPNIVNLPNS